MDARVERRLLGLLGLGVRGRLVVVGVDRVREAAHRGTLRVAVVAADASPHSREKVVGLLRAKAVPMLTIASAVALGAAAGRERTAVVGVVDVQLAKGIRGLAAPASAVHSVSRRMG